MGVLDNAVAHFDSLEIREIEVPEWETTIYASPFTLAEKKKLLRSAKDDDIEFLARTLMLKAKDEQGNAIFKEADKFTLMQKVDSTVVARVVSEISIAPSVEDQLGN
ncbi:MAG: hypothetical protein HOE82_06735 [Gammaproteobacteria bacterium]|jgi:hypothetical protein|nr:hypothetical protein [Gammaproteobacteria bacterium]